VIGIERLKGSLAAHDVAPVENYLFVFEFENVAFQPR
jgi:hypothetical protein